MGNKRRGRERLMSCESCGRTVPRDKAVDFDKRTTFTTDLRGQENVVTSTFRTVYYCISCAKHRKIFEKKRQIAERRRERAAGVF
jgi:ribosomal protein S26